jgi:hypothetical protein
VITAIAASFLIELLLVLGSGLYVLCHRGVSDLEAWGRFISQVLRGERVKLTPHKRSGDQD